MHRADKKRPTIFRLPLNLPKFAAKNLETKMMRTTLLFILICFLPVSLFPNEIDQLFKEANQAYQDKENSEAIEKYEAILNEGYHSLDLYYNLGNAYYRNGEIGKSILNYERALLLNPNDGDVQFNLSLARQQLKDNFEVLSTFFLTRWWRSLRQLASSTSWSILAMLVLWTGIGGFVLWLMGQARKTKKRGFFVGVVCLVGSMFLFSLAFSRTKFEENSGQAIILSSTVSLQNAPDEASTQILQLHEGTKVKLLDQIGDWHKVKLSDGDQGWLPDKALEQI